MSASKLFFKLFCFFFFSFFFLILPFDYVLLPDFNQMLQPAITGILKWISTILGVKGMDFNLVVYSDASGHYLFTAFLLVFSAFVSWSLLHLVNREFWTEKRMDAVQTFLAFCLSYFMFRYGLDKLLFNQFYPPSAIDLYTLVGSRTKDILYWNLMGVSGPYMFFSGWIEIVPAILLWFRKTRGLGALIASFVLLNVCMVNFGFDISVKLFSAMLLALSIWLSARFVKAVANLVSSAVRSRAYSEISAMPVFKHPVVYALLKTLAVLFILVDCLFPFVEIGFSERKYIPGHEIEGVWGLEVIRLSEANVSLELPFDFLILGKGKEAFLLNHGQQVNMFYKLSKNESRMELWNKDKRYDFEVMWLDSTKLVISDTIAMKAMLTMRKMPLQGLPLQRKGFHWTLDAQLKD